jgi:hypothetical protein
MAFDAHVSKRQNPEIIRFVKILCFTNLIISSFLYSPFWDCASNICKSRGYPEYLSKDVMQIAHISKCKYSRYNRPSKITSSEKELDLSNSSIIWLLT